MLNWLCPCTPAQQNTVLQEYPSVNINISAPRRQPINEEDISMGRATMAQTRQMIQQEVSLLKPRREQEVIKDKHGYLSIGSLREASSASNAVFRKIKKSRYEEILKECERKNQKWKDPDFNYEVKEPIKGWKRITEILNGVKFMKNEVKPTSVIQGQFNNCYWISAIAVLAEREYRIKSLFGSLQTNPWGVYMCRLLFDGVYQEVVVDDVFPVNDKGFLVTARISKGEFWPLVIEKCWAKLHKGYENTHMGFNMEALWAITASPVKGNYDTSLIRTDNGRRDKFYSLLKYHYEKKHIITCSVDRVFLAKDVDLQSMHSYSVLGIFQINFKGDNIKLLQIRNPLGHFGVFQFPDLHYNSKDSFWQSITPQEKERLDYWRIQSNMVGKTQGIFYVDWHDFLNCFNQVAIAQMDDNANYIYDTLPFHHYRPHFFSLNVTSDGPLHLIVAQQTPLTTKDRTGVWPYGVVRVLVSSITYDSNNQPVYQFILGKSLMEKEQTNYLDVDLSGLFPGNYIIRISVLFDAASSHNKHKPITVGYYSPGVFAVKPEEGVDDCDFLGRTMLSRAKQMVKENPSLKQPLRWAEGWSYIETIPDANYGYIVYHVEAGSQFERYNITLDQSDNQAGFFTEGHWVGHNTLNEAIKRGEEMVIPYSFGSFMPSSDRFPTFPDKRKKPVVTFQPVFK